MALVMCYYNGATPGDIEELVTRPLETAIMSVPGVDEVSSTSSDGVSQVQIDLCRGYGSGYRRHQAAGVVRYALPEGAMDP